MKYVNDKWFKIFLRFKKELKKSNNKANENQSKQIICAEGISLFVHSINDNNKF